ncbi:MAG: hypothetical protein M3O34_18080 [Chloroflexota bacterium]|nr:hypothetical protein [Chloroflexota bacterium]
MIDRSTEMTPNEVDAVNEFTRRTRRGDALESDLIAAQRLERMGYPLVVALRAANRVKVGLGLDGR